MKTMTKVILGGAVLAGAAAASHAQTTPIPQPSTGSSELLFFVNDYGNGTTYVAALSQTVGNNTGSYFTTTDSNNTSATKGSIIGTIYGDANFSYNYSGDTALQSFISAANGSIQWGLIGAAYPSTASLPDDTRGDVLLVSTGTNSTILGVAGSSVGNGIPAGYEDDLDNINVQTFDSYHGTANGFTCTPSSNGNANCDLYANGVDEAEPIGTGQSVYGLAASGKGGSYDYLIGTVTFNGSSLVFTGETQAGAVPLPAAAWLFGSGLLGLLGVARRRERDAVAAA
jgi:hypothetical protein